MKTRVEFKSKEFPKYENEDEETINANCWGKRLAEFVRDNLPKHGVQTKDMLCEDWGWLVYVEHDAFPVWIGCGVMEDPDEGEEEDGDDDEGDEAKARSLRNTAPGGRSEFTMFVTAEPGFIQKLFKKVDPNPVTAKVVAAVERMIEAHPALFEEVVWPGD